MRIDDAILSGSVVGSSATVSLTGSFTGSGHIFRADSASISDTSSFTISASFAVTASFVESASYAVTASFVESASYAVTASFVESASYALSSSHAADISDKIVDYATLGAEFTGSIVLTTTDFNVDFNAGSVFIKQNGGTDTLTFSNIKTGDVKTLRVTGGTGLTLPGSCTTLDSQATYDGTKVNILSIIAVSPAEQYNTLLQV